MISTPKETLRADLKGFCKWVFIFKKTCDSLLEKYFDKVHDILTAKLGPTICAYIGACSSQTISHPFYEYANEINLDDALCDSCKQYVPLIK